MRCVSHSDPSKPIIHDWASPFSYTLGFLGCSCAPISPIMGPCWLCLVCKTVNRKLTRKITNKKGLKNKIFKRWNSEGQRKTNQCEKLCIWFLLVVTILGEFPHQRKTRIDYGQPPELNIPNWNADWIGPRSDGLADF